MQRIPINTEDIVIGGGYASRDRTEHEGIYWDYGAESRNEIGEKI